MARKKNDWEPVNLETYLKDGAEKKVYNQVDGLEVVVYYTIGAKKNPQRIVINGEDYDVKDIHFHCFKDSDEWVGKHWDEICMKYLGHMV